MQGGRKLQFLLATAIFALAAGCATDTGGYVATYPVYPGYGYFDSAWGGYYDPFFWADYNDFGYYPACTPFCGVFYGYYPGFYYPGPARYPGPGWRQPPPSSGWQVHHGSHAGPYPAPHAVGGLGGRPAPRGAVPMHVGHSFGHGRGR